MPDFKRKDRMRKLYLVLFNLIFLIACPAAFAGEAQPWYPYPESDTVEEPGWFIFGAIVLAGIAISLGIYYSRKNANKSDDK
jgi:hypothetical protein